MKKTIAVCLLLFGCASASHRADDEAQLLAMHEAAMQAHRDSNVDALVARQADDFTVVNRGKVSTSTREATRKALGPYLRGTKFSVYRDLIPPRVKVSPDGKLGWVIAQVEAKGIQGDEPLEFVCAWISLFEKRNGTWVAVGNVSNFRE